MSPAPGAPALWPESPPCCVQSCEPGQGGAFLRPGRPRRPKTLLLCSRTPVGGGGLHWVMRSVSGSSSEQRGVGVGGGRDCLEFISLITFS